MAEAGSKVRQDDPARIRIRRVLVAYIIVASLWILFSDLAVSWLLDAESLTATVGMLKGLGFVAVTAALLGAYLRREQRRAFRSTARQVATAAALLEHFRALSSSVSDIVLLVDEQGRILEANDAAVDVLGWHRRALCERTIDDIEIRTARAGKPRTPSYASTFRLADGRMLSVEVDVLQLRVGSRSLRQFVARSSADLEDTRSGRRDRSWVDVFFDMPFIGMAITSPASQQWVRFNDRLCEILGYPREELEQLTWVDVTHPDDVRQDETQFEKVVRGETDGYRSEKRFVRKDGRVLHAEIDVRCRRLPSGAVDYFVATVQDVTGRVLAASALSDSEERFRLAVEEAPIPIMIHAEDGEVLALSRAWTETSGYGIDDIPTLAQWTALAYGERSAEVTSVIDRTYASARRIHEGVFRVRCRDGSERYWEFSSIALPALADGRRTAISMAADITDHKRAEADARLHSQRMELAQASARIGTWDCDIPSATLHMHHGTPALFGFTPEPCSMSLSTYVELMHPEDRQPFLERVQRHLAQGGEYFSKYRFIWPDGSVHWIEDRRLLHHDEAGRPVRAFGINIDVTEQVAADARIREYIARLERSMHGTVEAIAHMVDLRDPYTAGHELRVGALAEAIGREMGLEDTVCQGLQITGRVHDIGKINIPAEILSKPGRLSELEMSMVRTHAEVGWEILKDIEFDWPVADVVRQHHERLDGSGYPRGLKGEQIILEARIMAVADVVESMASHRPYRPSKGIEAALEEIEDKAGSLYDKAVVGACTRLFREKGFKLS